MVAYSAFPLVQATSRSSIKLLDLLTNRYYPGVLRKSTPTYLLVELSGVSCFRAGQRVRFVVADDQSLVSRTEMRRGFIANVFVGEKNKVNVYVALQPEPELAMV